MELNFANNLLSFINNSPTAFHAVESSVTLLLQSGFKELNDSDNWQIKKNEKYFITRNGSTIIAFTIGSTDPEKSGFKIIGTHTDSPSLKIKANPEIVSEESYLKLNTEVYGGPILNTWYDRPLSLAGRVVLKGKNPLSPIAKNINLNKPLLTIPNLAIHMNKDINNGIKIDKQKELLPLLSMVNDGFEKDNFLINNIAGELNVDKENILDMELYLYEYESGTITGLNDEFISSSRIDNLQSFYASLISLIEADNSKSINIIASFDNEEVGSATKQGADSQILSNILERISISLTKNREGFFRALSNSFIISADCAHAIHPSKGDVGDITNRPIVNKGPVIKYSANQSYTSDSVSASVFKEICNEIEVPYQEFHNNSNYPGGSTIGPISSTHLDIKSVDIGVPILAMHSIRELCGVKDNYYLKKSFDRFFK